VIKDDGKEKHNQHQRPEHDPRHFGQDACTPVEFGIPERGRMGMFCLQVHVTSICVTVSINNDKLLFKSEFIEKHYHGADIGYACKGEHDPHEPWEPPECFVEIESCCKKGP
jgi:hypothetical protein